MTRALLFIFVMVGAAGCETYAEGPMGPAVVTDPIDVSASGPAPQPGGTSFYLSACTFPEGFVAARDSTALSR